MDTWSYGKVKDYKAKSKTCPELAAALSAIEGEVEGWQIKIQKMSRGVRFFCILIFSFFRLFANR